MENLQRIRKAFESALERDVTIMPDFRVRRASFLKHLETYTLRCDKCLHEWIVDVDFLDPKFLSKDRGTHGYGDCPKGCNVVQSVQKQA